MADDNAGGQDTTDAGADSSVEETGTILGGEETTDDTAAQDKDAGSDDDSTQDDDGTGADDDKDKDSDDNDSDDKDGDDEEDDSEAELFDSSKLELPEGFEMDADLMGEFEPLAKELKLTQEQGAKFTELYTQGVQKVFDNILAQQTAAIQQWAKDTQADTEIGNANYEESTKLASKAIQTFGSDKLKEALNQTGMGNHPELVRMMVNIGKAISEDSFTAPDAGTGQKDDLSSIYDHPTSKT